MTLAEADRRLERLREAVERTVANLLELELDPDRRLLDETALAGETAAAWAATSAELIQLWQRLELLKALLARAEGIRGTKGRLRDDRLAELAALLDGRSIEVASDSVPIVQRDLLAQAQPTRRYTAAELLSEMSSSFAAAREVVARVAGAWNDLVPRLRSARADLDAAVTVADELDEEESVDLELARRRLVQLGQALAEDPLAVAPADIEALEASAAAIRREHEDIAQLDRDHAARLAGCRALLAELRTAQQEARAAYDDLVLKIEAPEVGPAAPAPDIDAELADVVALTESGSRREARAALAGFEEHARAMLAAACSLAAASRAPIEQRNELRGRLDAYEVKAKRLGLIEDRELSALLDRARAVLYTAPTDLAAAEALVRGYQQALTDHRGRGVAR